MSDVSGEEVWVSSSDNEHYGNEHYGNQQYANQQDGNQQGSEQFAGQPYAVDPADPYEGEVWAQTDLTEEYVVDPGNPGYDEQA